VGIGIANQLHDDAACATLHGESFTVCKPVASHWPCALEPRRRHGHPHVGFSAIARAGTVPARASYDPHVRVLAGSAVLCAALSLLASEPVAAGKPSGTFAGCPHATLPLPNAASAYAGAARAIVLRFVRTHPLRMQTAGARADGVLLVRHWLPSGWVRSECGLRVWQRSLVVGVYYPAMDPPHNPIGHCNACARISFLLSRTPGGWLVWGLF
jgi:hypothetical protein